MTEPVLNHVFPLPFLTSDDSASHLRFRAAGRRPTRAAAVASVAAPFRLPRGVRRRALRVSVTPDTTLTRSGDRSAEGAPCLGVSHPIQRALGLTSAIESGLVSLRPDSLRSDRRSVSTMSWVANVVLTNFTGGEGIAVLIGALEVTNRRCSRRRSKCPSPQGSQACRGARAEGELVAECVNITFVCSTTRFVGPAMSATTSLIKSMHSPPNLSRVSHRHQITRANLVAKGGVEWEAKDLDRLLRLDALESDSETWGGRRR